MRRKEEKWEIVSAEWRESEKESERERERERERKPMTMNKSQSIDCERWLQGKHHTSQTAVSDCQ